MFSVIRIPLGMLNVIRIRKDLTHHKPYVIVHSYSTLDINGLIIPFV